MHEKLFPAKILIFLLNSFIPGILITSGLVYLTPASQAMAFPNQWFLIYLMLAIALFCLTLPLQLSMAKRLDDNILKVAGKDLLLEESRTGSIMKVVRESPLRAGLLHSGGQILALGLLCFYIIYNLDYRNLSFPMQQFSMTILIGLEGLYFSSILLYQTLGTALVGPVRDYARNYERNYRLASSSLEKLRGEQTGEQAEPAQGLTQLSQGVPALLKGTFFYLIPLILFHLTLYFAFSGGFTSSAEDHRLFFYKFVGILAIHLVAVLLVLGADHRKMQAIGKQIRQFLQAYLGPHMNPVSLRFNDTEAGLSVMTLFMEAYLSQFTILENQIRHLSKVLVNLTSNLTSSSEEVIVTANQQSAAVKEIVTTLESSNELSKDIQAKSNNVHLLSAQTKENVDKGLALLEENIRQMDEIKKTNTGLIFDIQALGEQMVNIGEIVTIINKIAHQTKIIAFNAELQASASKESGKNFEIVASEIRRLVDNTVTSTTEIKTKIKEVQQSAKKLTKTFENETIEINQGWELTAKLKKVFDNILSSSDSSTMASQTIGASIDEQAVLIEQVLITLRQISEGIDSFVLSTNSSEEAADLLKSMAVELNEMLGKLPEKTPYKGV
jgi:methyl-accepting chemotaxis protein